jgi:hypothetical protein
MALPPALGVLAAGQPGAGICLYFKCVIYSTVEQSRPFQQALATSAQVKRATGLVRE